MSWLKPRPTKIFALWRGGGFAAAGLLGARETAHRNALRAIDCYVGAEAPTHKHFRVLARGAGSRRRDYLVRERRRIGTRFARLIVMSGLKPRPTKIFALWRGGGFAAAGLLAARETAHRNALRATILVARLKPCPDEEQW